MNLIAELQKKATRKIMEEVTPKQNEGEQSVAAPSVSAVADQTPTPAEPPKAEQPVQQSQQVNILQVLFESRDLTHYWHLQTESYAQHMALGAYYDGVLLLADQFMEALQGITGARVKGPITIQLVDYTSEGCKAHLQDVKNKIAVTYKSVETYTDLTNILDELYALINRTLYLLTLQ